MMKKLKTTMALAVVVYLMNPAALAANGGCPVGMEGKTPFTPVTEQKGAVDVHLYVEMPLADQTIAAQGWRYRARSITLAPGAIIPVHSHNDRPEVAMMKQGAVTIYELDCKTGYTMEKGEVYQSGHGKSHWVVNETEQYAIMFVTDLVRNDSFPVK